MTILKTFPNQKWKTINPIPEEKLPSEEEKVTI